MLASASASTWQLSVSSFGSFPLQLKTTAATNTTTIFQYPRSDRFLCNHTLDPFYSRVTSVFQYPRSDRFLCNCNNLSVFPISVKLSVSSFGSFPLQRQSGLTNVCRRCTLSVSSFGSFPLQRQSGLTNVCRRCTLSVSSFGSFPLQRQRTQQWNLYQPSFQYPRSDRYLCNVQVLFGLPEERSFQYPRSDRYLCNLADMPDDSIWIFSFQYPRSDRYLCNRFTV